MWGSFDLFLALQVQELRSFLVDFCPCYYLAIRSVAELLLSDPKQVPVHFFFPLQLYKVIIYSLFCKTLINT